MALEAAAGTVHVAFWSGGDPLIRIASGPTTGNALQLSPTTVAIGAGPVPATQIVLHGSAGWLVQVNRDVVGGARLVGGSVAAVAAAVPRHRRTRLACRLERHESRCRVRHRAVVDAGGRPPVHIGVTGAPRSRRRPAALPISALSGVTTAPSQPTIVAAGTQADGTTALIGRFNGASSWTTVATLAGTGTFSELGFTTNAQGVAIGHPTGAASQLLMTRDGGHTWTVIEIAGG